MASAGFLLEGVPGSGLGPIGFQQPYLHIGEPAYDPLTPPDAGYTKSCSQCIGIGTTGGDHSGTYMIPKTDPGSGVDDVRVSYSLML